MDPSTLAALERLVPPLLGLAVWGGLTLWLARQIWLSRRSRRWPATPGRILDARVEFDPWRVQRIRAAASVRYEYEVGGRTYQGRRLRFGGSLNLDPVRAGRDTARYPRGHVVPVRYDPRRPSRSTLDSSPPRQAYLLLVIGLFMVLAILGALLGFWE